MSAVSPVLSTPQVSSSTPLYILLLIFVGGVAVGFFASLPLMRSWFSGWGAVVKGKAQQFSHLMTTGEEVKMTLVVRKDLKMGTGKIAAQCAHAAVAVVEDLQSHRESAQGASADVLRVEYQYWLQWYDAWKFTGCAKVALQCPDEIALMDIARKAKSAGLPHYVIRDAGRTQIAAGSKTVVAVGPGPKSLVDSVTGDLKLL